MLTATVSNCCHSNAPARKPDENQLHQHFYWPPSAQNSRRCAAAPPTPHLRTLAVSCRLGQRDPPPPHPNHHPPPPAQITLSEMFPETGFIYRSSETESIYVFTAVFKVNFISQRNTNSEQQLKVPTPPTPPRPSEQKRILNKSKIDSSKPTKSPQTSIYTRDKLVPLQSDSFSAGFNPPTTRSR